ncbi:hypothetical protein [Mucilaginibacter sp. OK098]|uniref:hypothetical protein n=1 Tax=Mucilaginibacter sp. OK098 TaxID=1855297 RepID=UPI0009238CE6|nr:hypothetical protein [Mucilaginibacter sp. OK098]SHN24755.1 hypothetical protein SAMN05216524_107200 [Mucilaginibacter sp. OK098]
MKTSLIFIIMLIVLTGCSSGMKPQFRTDHFMFIYNAKFDKKEARDVANVLEANYVRISKDLKTTPTDPIEVSLYTSRWTYATTHGHWTTGGNIEGSGKLHFLQHGWDEMDIKKIAIHEFSHAVMLKLLLDREPKPLDVTGFDKKFNAFPVWLYEAIAVYEAKQFVDPKTLPFFSNNSFPDLNELNNRIKGSKIYKVGYTIIEYLLNKYGQDKLITLIASYGNLKVLNTTDSSFANGWHEFVKEKYLNK